MLRYNFDSLNIRMHFAGFMSWADQKVWSTLVHFHNFIKFCNCMNILVGTGRICFLQKPEKSGSSVDARHNKIFFVGDAQITSAENGPLAKCTFQTRWLLP